MIQAWWIPIEPGIFEYIHANRMRIPPLITANGLTPQYSVKLLTNNEVFSRMTMVDSQSGEVVSRYAVQFSFNTEFDAELQDANFIVSCYKPR